MAQLQGVYDCIAELTDAELQRAAVADQRAHVQCNRILGARNRRIRRTEQPRARIFQQVVEGVCRDQRIAVHEGQLAVDLTDQRERAAARTHLRDLRQQVGSEVRICAEAQQARGRFAGRRSRDQLRDYVQPASQSVACDVRVVRAEIVLLKLLAAQPGAGLEEEFDDFDVVGQLALLDEPHVFQLGIAAEHTLGQRLDQASLEIAAPARLAQRQGRNDREPDRRVGERARDEGVDQPVRLADGDGQPQHHVLADAAQGCFDAFLGTGVANRRRLIHAAISVPWKGGTKCNRNSTGALVASLVLYVLRVGRARYFSSSTKFTFTSFATVEVSFQSPWPTPKSSRLSCAEPLSQAPPSFFSNVNSIGTSRVTLRKVSLPDAAYLLPPLAVKRSATYCELGNCFTANRSSLLSVSSRSLSRVLTEAGSIFTSKRLPARSCGSNLMSAVKRSKAPSNSVPEFRRKSVCFRAAAGSTAWRLARRCRRPGPGRAVERMAGVYAWVSSGW